jgi:hypothetical protein
MVLNLQLASLYLGKLCLDLSAENAFGFTKTVNPLKTHKSPNRRNMKVTFKSIKDNVTWVSEPHQLNSDILLRHFLTRAKTKDLNLAFSYCESTHTGTITNVHDELIGKFSLQA